VLLHLPVLAVVISLLGAYLMPLIYHYKRNLAPLVAVGVSGVAACFSAAVALYVSRHGAFSYLLGMWSMPWGIEVYVDRMSAFMMLVISSITFFVMVYAMEDACHELSEPPRRWYWTLNLLLLASMMGVVMAGDLFNLFVFVEISSVAACGTISVKGDRRAVEATFRYLVLSTLGSGALLLSIALLYMVTGNLNMAYISGEMQKAAFLYPKNLYAALTFMVVGFGVKSALFPLHSWLPDAHSAAPAPSSAVLSGLVVKIYIFALFRVLDRVFGPVIASIPVETVVLFMATMAVMIGSVLAMGQKELKRMLAYSTVAQVGYVFLGLALGADRAVAGGMMHILTHALMKSTLFMAAGAVFCKTGKKNVSDLAGLGPRMPVTMGVFSLAAASMIGVPLLGGFVSKWYLALGATDAGKSFYALIVVLSSFLTALYFIPPVISAFFGKPSDDLAEKAVDEAPAFMLVPMVVLAVALLGIGLFPSLVLGLLGYRG